MAEYKVREYTASDIPGIRRLWEEIFGDGEATVNSVLNNLQNMGTAAVCEYEGEVVGFALALVGQELVYADSVRRPVVGYIYAVGMDEKHRSSGGGSALVKCASELAKKRGATVMTTLPAEESLYPWYEKLMGVRCILSREEKTVNCADIEPAAKLSSSEYLLWRDMMLKGKNHLRPSSYAMEALKQFFESLGGGLYACGTGIAAGYPENGIAYIRELVSAEEGMTDDIAASVGKMMGAERAVYFIPAEAGKRYIAADRDLPKDIVWSFTFD